MGADLSAAACVGADPLYFDDFTYPAAHVALSYCERCPMTAVCLEIVRPQKSHYDGVAGGVVWRNGYRVRPDNSTREDRLKRNGVI